MENQTQDALDDLDLEPKERLLRINGNFYLQREASAGAVLAYQKKMADVAKYDGDGKPTAIDPGGVREGEIALVAHCLFETVDGKGTDSAGNPVKTVKTQRVSNEDVPVNVTVQFVSRLTNRRQESLLEWVQDSSNLRSNLASLKAQRAALDQRIAALEAKENDQPLKN